MINQPSKLHWRGELMRKDDEKKRYTASLKLLFVKPCQSIQIKVLIGNKNVYLNTQQNYKKNNNKKQSKALWLPTQL